jgi:CheY-like chemotaxis protein
MSKNILIVESDPNLSATLRQSLEAKGFAVQETTDGKGSVELIRRERPELVVLAVDLSAGQNGYLICGKLKKDDDLKAIPIVIIGNPDGFAQHRKLKAHADDYVAKPVNPEDLVERVGALVGFPELPPAEVVDDGGFAMDGLDGLGEEPAMPAGTEELAIEGEPLESGEDMSMLDSAFGEATQPDPEPALATFEEPVEAPPEPQSSEEDFSALDGLGGDADSALDSLGMDGMDSDKTVIGFAPTPPPPAPPPPAPAPAPTPPPRSSMTVPSVATRPSATPTPAAPTRSPLAAAAAPARATAPAAPAMSAADAAELRNLRARVVELESALEDSRQQHSSTESRVHELESELDAKTTELETVKASAGKNDTATFQLREASNRKDKEILRLKGELNQKEQELVELRDRQLELEQQATSATDEITRRDAQIKTLTTKTEQLTTERRRVEQALATAKEEARGATARATALQAEMDQLHALQTESEELRAQLGQAQADLDAVRAEADDLRAQLGQAQADVDAVRAEAGQHAEEGESLRRRVAELEESVARNEDRVARLYTRIKNDEKLRDRTKKALAIATQLLEEQPANADDEEAVA